MYLFASGENRPRMGFYGTDHNWQAPIDKDGEKNSNYEDIKRSIKDIWANRKVFLADNRYDIALGIKNSYGLIWRNICRISNEAYFALRCAGFMPEIVDFEYEDIQKLSKILALWVVTDEFMEESVQQKLCDYVRNGGKLILQGSIPILKAPGQICTLLADELGLAVDSVPHKDEDCPQQKILVDKKEYYIGRTIQKFRADNAIILAREWQENAPAVAAIRYGEGGVLVMPFRIDMKFYSMADCIQYLLSKIAVYPSVIGNRMLGVIPKQGNRNVILNPHPVSVHERIIIEGIEHDIKLEPHSFVII